MDAILRGDSSVRLTRTFSLFTLTHSYTQNSLHMSARIKGLKDGSLDNGESFIKTGDMSDQIRSVSYLRLITFQSTRLPVQRLTPYAYVGKHALWESVKSIAALSGRHFNLVLYHFIWTTPATKSLFFDNIVLSPSRWTFWVTVVIITSPLQLLHHFYLIIFFRICFSICRFTYIPSLWTQSCV